MKSFLIASDIENIESKLNMDALDFIIDNGRFNLASGHRTPT